MIEINTITHRNVQLTLFPDGQPHVDLQNIEPGMEVKVVTPLYRANDVLHLLQITNALDAIGARKADLHIPYLMAARYDRHMRFGDSFDLEVVANLINSCNFKRVTILDPHSQKSLVLIKNSIGISNKFMVQAYKRDNAVLIVPDKGAGDKAMSYQEWNPGIVNVVGCYKSRDLDSGRITLKVLNPETCKGRDCVIIDDICDGGATFLAISDQIEPSHLTLMVTHGIFSKGLRCLTDKFDQIVTTDSYLQTERHSKLKVISLYAPAAPNGLV